MEVFLSIPIISCSTIEEALKAFFSDESLTGDNSFICSDCQTTVSALQSIELSNTSSAIFIHFKRFFSDKTTKRIQRYNQFISYPELLDFSPFINKSVLQFNEERDKYNEFVYRLYAVVIHVGETVKYGRIFSYIRSPDNFWYKANDESIIQTNLDTILADNNSYILCYNKTTKANTIVPEIQIDAFVEGTPHCLFLSTPIRPNETNYKTTHDDSIVGKTSILTCLSHLFCYIRSNFPLNISSFDNGSPMALDMADSHTSKTHVSTTKYSKLNFINVSNELVCLILDISYSSSSSEEDISPFKSQ